MIGGRSIADVLESSVQEMLERTSASLAASAALRHQTFKVTLGTLNATAQMHGAFGGSAHRETIRSTCATELKQRADEAYAALLDTQAAMGLVATDQLRQVSIEWMSARVFHEASSLEPLLVQPMRAFGETGDAPRLNEECALVLAASVSEINNHFDRVQRLGGGDAAAIASGDLRFPEELATSISYRKFYVIENRDISEPDDLAHLLQRLFDHPERSFYLFRQKEASFTSELDGTFALGDILITKTDLQYYRHPNFKRDFIRIPPDPFFDWERELIQSGATEYLRVTLALSERKRRAMEIDEHLTAQARRTANPVKLEPNFMGVGFDLKKVFALYRTWLRNRRGKV